MWQDNTSKWKYVEHALSRKQERQKQRTGLATLRGKTQRKSKEKMQEQTELLEGDKTWDKVRMLAENI